MQELHLVYVFGLSDGTFSPWISKEFSKGFFITFNVLKGFTRMKIQMSYVRAECSAEPQGANTCLVTGGAVTAGAKSAGVEGVAREIST